MFNPLHHWLNNLALNDPSERRQAGLFQGMLLIVLGACLIGMPLTLVTSPGSLVGLSAYLLIMVGTGLALALLRSGRLAPAVMLAAGAIVLAIGFSLVVSGLNGGSGALLALSVPITLAGLLQGRRGLLLTVGLSIALVVTTAVLQTWVPGLVGFGPERTRAPLSMAATFMLVIGVLALFLDRFGSSLRQALDESLAREHELEQLRGTLEGTVAKRTASLQAALHDVEQREARLTQTLGELNASRDIVRELSAPIIPVLPGVLVATLIGDMDEARTDAFTTNLLTAVERQRARHVIFDITGVPVVDTHVAQALLSAAAAVRLLGARAMLVGIRPEVAQTLVSLGAGLETLHTYPDLQEAVGTLLN